MVNRMGIQMAAMVSTVSCSVITVLGIGLSARVVTTVETTMIAPAARVPNSYVDLHMAAGVRIVMVRRVTGMPGSAVVHGMAGMPGSAGTGMTTFLMGGFAGSVVTVLCFRLRARMASAMGSRVAPTACTTPPMAVMRLIVCDREVLAYLIPIGLRLLTGRHLLADFIPAGLRLFPRLHRGCRNGTVLR